MKNHSASKPGSNTAKELISELRSTIESKYWSNAPIRQLLQEYSQGIDKILTKIWLNHFETDSNSALYAVGGYGRQEMSFYSDVDLMFLIGKLDNPTSNYISEILHILWDFHLDIGYSSRTISEALKLAKGDIESCTAMMDGRFLVGDGDLFSGLYEKLYLNVPSLIY